MVSLSVKQFSCIDSAVIDLARLTVIIGPQASGKSVLSKLTYFAYSLLDSSFAAYSEVTSLQQFEQKTIADFIALFPVSAWGTNPFEIRLTAGFYVVVISRSKAKTSTVKVQFSDYFIDLRQRFLDALTVARTNEVARTNAGQRASVEMNVSGEFYNQLSNDLGADWFASKLFVPAGRSFFINTSKMSAVEISKQVDSITASFGRMYKFFQDGSFPEPHSLVPPTRAKLERTLNAELFGGNIRITKDTQEVEASDGRIIPFSALSSGQQELLPLWMMINFYASFAAHGCLSFIEEPEAHLFPRAQHLLTNYLCSIVAENEMRNAMVITTHSPYVLSKVNNILYAESLVERFPRRKRTVAKIVDEKLWLSAKQVTAYAIVDRQLVSIMDDDGLIDAAFLDSVSNDISDEYVRLMQLDEKLSNAS